MHLIVPELQHGAPRASTDQSNGVRSFKWLNTFLPEFADSNALSHSYRRFVSFRKEFEKMRKIAEQSE